MSANFYHMHLTALQTANPQGFNQKSFLKTFLTKIQDHLHHKPLTVVPNQGKQGRKDEREK